MTVGVYWPPLHSNTSNNLSLEWLVWTATCWPGWTCLKHSKNRSPLNTCSSKKWAAINWVLCTGSRTLNTTHCSNRNSIRYQLIIVFILLTKKIFSCLNPFARPASLEKIRRFVARMKYYLITKESVLSLQDGHVTYTWQYSTSPNHQSAHNTY